MRYSENNEMRIKEAYNPFNLIDGINSKTTITISVTGSSHATIPATGFNKGDTVKTFLNTSYSVILLKEVYKNSSNTTPLIISAIRISLLILCPYFKSLLIFFALKFAGCSPNKGAELIFEIIL